MNYPINDPHFRVEVLSKTERPNLLSYLAMHQCYSENVIIDEVETLSQLSEKELGDRVVKNCLKFGHWSVIEPPHITFCVSGFPHNVMVQATRHRLLSFSVQSQRYTGKRIEKLALDYKDTPLGVDEEWLKKAEALFYLRPVGEYFDREGRKYLYSQDDKDIDSSYLSQFVLDYRDRLGQGHAPEHARDFLPQNIRQDFVVTFNARSLLHFCDLRIPKDSQLEIRTLAEMLFEKFKEWMPECAEWYEKNRYGKNRLSP
jgi:thymidylate synthase (FAD)